MQPIEAYQIVIKDNEASLYYSRYCRSSWTSAGIKVNTFDAITPSHLSKYNELKFSKYSSRKLLLDKNIKALITDTEKACWYSHYTLWKECVYLNQPIYPLKQYPINKAPTECN